MRKTLGFIMSFTLAISTSGQSLVFTPSSEPVEVAPSSFGNKAIRMVVNGMGNPVVTFGSNGHLYVCVWNATANAFGSPYEIDADSNVFMSDAEGPRMASEGDYLVITYQISGDWANGARSVHSTDGGLSWSEPTAMVTGATVDHFMPCVAIDGNGNPFAGVKVGNGPEGIYEGILRSADGGNNWLPAVNASSAATGDAVCECCPSQPFFTEGRYYDLVRNNNGNIRDFWLMSSEDGDVWDAALDIDPLDWEINACPESGATTIGPLQNDECLVAFMSGGGPSGQSRIYVSSVNLQANGGGGEWLSTAPVSVGQFDNATQNTPALGLWNDGAGNEIIALAWEQNSGGYDVQLTLSTGENWTLIDGAQNLTSEWSGQHRKPALSFSTDLNGNPLLHLAWQHSSSGTVHYMRGNISSPLGTICLAHSEPRIVQSETGFELTVSADWAESTYHLWSADGRVLDSGLVPAMGNTYRQLFFSTNELPSHAILSLRRSDGIRWAHHIMRR